jgi:hypothetical protein
MRMRRLLSTIERLFGKTSERPRMRVSGDRIPADAADLATLTRMLTREPVKLEPTIPIKGSLTTDDIDKETGRSYPDCLERRARRAEKEAGESFTRTLSRDFRPD